MDALELRNTDDFQLLRFFAGFNSRKSVADYLRVAPSTVLRWENGDTNTPFHVRELLLLLAGYLPDTGRRQNWHGWRFVDEFLYTPDGDKFTAEDIKGIRIMYQQLRTYRVELRELKKQLDNLTTESKQASNSNIIPFPVHKAR